MNEFSKPPDQGLMREAMARGTPFTEDPDKDLLAYSEKRREAEKNISADVTGTLKANTAGMEPADEPAIEKGLVDKLVRFVDKIVH